MKRFLAFLTIASVCIGLSSTAFGQRYQVGDIVENFTLIDRDTGETVDLYDLEGKVIFLEWFAWWCPFCQAAAGEITPGIVEYYESLGGTATGADFIHVGLNLQGGQESQTQSFIDSFGFGLVLNDFNRTVSNRFQGSGQPIFAIINGIDNSPSHQQWELLYSQLGYGQLQFPISTFRSVVDSVQPASQTGYAGYIESLEIPEEQAGFNQDADGDGCANGLEYATGTDASDPSSYPAVIQRTISLEGQNYLEIEVSSDSEASDIDLILQVDTDITFSNPSTGTLEDSAALSGTLTTNTYRSDVPIGNSPLFVRLKAETL